MSRPARLDLSPDHRQLVLQILRANLPLGSKVWVFGSRASGRARRFSDLDLVVDVGRPLTLEEAASLSEAFSDSDLPYRVDLIDWQQIGEPFRQIIAAERIPLAA